jgi:hypothetical protein
VRERRERERERERERVVPLQKILVHDVDIH